MLTSLVFIVASKGKKVKKIDNSLNQISKNLYLLRDLLNFNNIFGKNVTHDVIKSG